MIKLKSLLTESIFNFEPDASSLKAAMQPSKFTGNQPPIDSLISDWLYTDSTKNMAQKYKFVKANIGTSTIEKLESLQQLHLNSFQLHVVAQKGYQQRSI